MYNIIHTYITKAYKKVIQTQFAFKKSFSKDISTNSKRHCLHSVAIFNIKTVQENSWNDAHTFLTSPYRGEARPCLTSYYTH